MSLSCQQTWKADAPEDGSLSAGDAASFERHSKICQACRDRVRLDRHLRHLVEELPEANPLDLPLRRLRGRILSDARQEATRRPRPRWPVLMFAAVALAVLATLAVVSGLRFLPRVLPPEDPLAGSVTAVPGADWGQSRHEKVETVRLTRGELWIVVRKQMPGEQFLVAMPDGELEVRGTTFDVMVEGRSTRRVHVVEGRVAVRLRDRPAVELAAGDTWDRDTPETSAPVASARLPTSSALTTLLESPTSPKQVPRPLASISRPSDDGSNDYEIAMKLYLSGRFGEAAEVFRQFEAQHPNSVFLEDVTFLEALSLTKVGHVDAGAVAASRHLAAFPGSFHAKEASILLARAARNRGECEAARQALAPWQGTNTDSTIRDVLGACAAR